MTRTRCRPLALLLLLAGCGRHPQPPAPAQPPEGEVWLTPKQVDDGHIRAEPLQSHALDSSLRLSGRVAFDEQRVVHLHSPVSGRVTRVEANLGDRVKKGAALATLVSPEVGSASSDLDKAQADLVASQRELERQQELFAAHAGPRRDLEAAQDLEARARAELQRARQKARLLQGGTVDVVTQTFTLRSPLDGEVIHRAVAVGTEVAGQYGGGATPELFTIGEIDRVWVMADAHEINLSRIQAGQRVRVRVVAFPDKQFDGQVDWVSSALDEASRTAQVRCTLPNPDRALKPEMYATVVIETQGSLVPALPREAVLRVGGQPIVFVEQGTAPDGRLRFVRTPVGVDDEGDGGWVQVTGGLDAGARVVTSQAILLSGMVH